MTDNDQPIPEEQADAPFLQMISRMYATREQNAHDHAEMQARLQDVIRTRSSSQTKVLIAEDKLPHSEDTINVEAEYGNTKTLSGRKPKRGGLQARFKRKRHPLIHQFESIAALLVVLALVLGWFIFVPKLRPLARPAHQISQITPTIQLPQTIQVTRKATAGTFLTNALGSVYLPAWTPDSHYLSFVDGKGNAYVWDAQKNTLMKTISLPGSVSPDPIATWNRAPGGRYLISFKHHTTIQVWDVITGQLLLNGTTGCFAWSASGTHLAMSNGHMVQLWDLPTHKLLLNIPTGEGCPLSWSPDERSILIPSLDNQGFSVVNATTGFIMWSKPLPPNTTSLNSVWSSDSQRLVTLTSVGTEGSTSSQQIWNAVSGQQLFARDLSDPVNGPFWSQDGVHILTITKQDIMIWNSLTGHTVSLPNAESSSLWYSNSSPLSPDGKLFAIEDDASSIQIWSIETGTSVFTYHAHAKLIKGGISWSPDSQSLVSVEEGGQVTAWNVTNGQTLRSYSFSWFAANSPFFQETGLAWSPDGKWIAVISDQSTAAVVNAP